MTYSSNNLIRKVSNNSRGQSLTKNIFISYSHRDEKYKNEVVKTLNGLKNIFPSLEIEIWSDDRIRSGKEWLKEIEKALESAGIAVLIISRDFIASDFIMKTEVPSLLKNAEAKGTIILNVVAGKSILNDAIQKFQFVNDPNEPLKSMTEHQQDVIYTKLADDIIFYLQ